MIPNDVMARFRKTMDRLNSDIYMQHLGNLHGPYEVVEPHLVYNDGGPFESNHVKHICIACNTLWPCVTFTVLEDKAIAINNARITNGRD